MKMPIVSMNKMAMNESVATTCCFRQVPTASVVYWEVLHGGWIGKGYVEKLNFKSAYSALDGTKVMNAPYDFTGGATGFVAEMAKTSVAYLSEPGEDSKWLFWPDGITTGMDYYEYATYLGGASVYSCKHDNGDCKYKEYAIELVDNYHFDATSAHAGKSNWAKGHSISQYSS